MDKLQNAARSAYATTQDLGTRINTHELYSVSPQSWPEWLLGQVPRDNIRNVLDIGCGMGGLLRQMAAAGIGTQWLGIDQSAAMIAQAQEAAKQTGLAIQYRQGDLRDNFGEERFDLICACFMLNYLPDINAAVRHCAKALSPQGSFFAATNSELTMAPYWHAAWQAISERLPHIKLNTATAERFTLENGAEYLIPSYSNIELRIRRDAFYFPEPAPWADYLKSSRHIKMPLGHTEADWRQVAEVIDAVVAEQFAHGPLTVPKIAGVFLCRDAFITQ
jgi:2-polyprenyl-3-methyl-5-hydroxy-6-metoxy-1,4-benzoquinol methylase